MSMGQNHSPDDSRWPDKLPEVFNTDYFNNLTALAASICITPFACILLPVAGRLACAARFGFTDSTVDPLFSLNADAVIIKDAAAIAGQFVINGEPVEFFLSIRVFADQDLWMCVMDHRPSRLAEPQLMQLGMLAKQFAALYNLSAQPITPDIHGQVDQKLLEQKAFYEKILDKIPTDIAVFDANHRYLFVNPGAISVKEYRDYIIGKDDYEYAAYRNRDASIADVRREQFLQVKRTGKEIRWEENIKRPDGSIVTVLRYMFPVVEDNGEVNIVIGYGIDINHRKLLEEKQAELVKQLSLQNTQLVDFCNIVSHNLRAPMVNMSMLVDFIKETDDPDEHKLLIDKLGPVVENLHATLNELVESIQVRQDIEVETERMSFADVLTRTLKGLETEINQQSADIHHQFDEAAEVSFPPKYLHSIFHNFLSNASKYRSPKRRLCITIKSNRVGDSIILQFTDNGQGIDLAKHGNKLFKIGKVFHEHPDAKGFGLYMTKTQVEAMNGRIWVESLPDEGTTFYVEFKNQAYRR